MRRRSFLLAAAAPALFSIASPGFAETATRYTTPRGSGSDLRRLAVRHEKTGASFSGPYHNGRAPDPVAIRELSEVLADTRTGQVKSFDTRTLDFIWEVGRREGIDEFSVLSGYRTPVTNFLARGVRDSFHLRAAAIDLNLPAAHLARFADTAYGLSRGGVGLYLRRGFVHLDSGPVRRWGGGGGKRANDRIGRIAEAWRSAQPRR